MAIALASLGGCWSANGQHWGVIDDHEPEAPAAGSPAQAANFHYHDRLMKLANLLEKTALPTHVVRGKPWRYLSFRDTREGMALDILVGGDDVAPTVHGGPDMRAEAALVTRTPVILRHVAMAGLLTHEAPWRLIHIGVSYEVDDEDTTGSHDPLISAHPSFAETLISIDSAREYAEGTLGLRTMLGRSRSFLNATPLRPLKGGAD